MFLWAIRHPASGYVQGINDLVTPFFVVFLSEYLPSTFFLYPTQEFLFTYFIIIIVGDDVELCDISKIAKEDLDKIEADCFWCMGKLLDYIEV